MFWKNILKDFGIELIINTIQNSGEIQPWRKSQHGRSAVSGMVGVGEVAELGVFHVVIIPAGRYICQAGNFWREWIPCRERIVALLYHIGFISALSILPLWFNLPKVFTFFYSTKSAPLFSTLPLPFIFLLANLANILYPEFMDIQNPHDKFFKEVFSNKETAIDYFKHFLPVEISRNIDFRTLKQDNNSYIDEELKEYFSDLVYQCRYRGKHPVNLVLLFEHKSYVPEYPHLQLLKYLLKIWENCLKQEKKLVAVVPMIFYHGKDKWEMKPFSQYFKDLDETLTTFIPDIKYLLTDLSRLRMKK